MNVGEDRLGKVLRDGDRTGLQYVRRLAHPPAKVWLALTESEQLRRWFPADIVGERRPGAMLSLPFWPELVEAMNIEQPVNTGELRVWEPPRTLELTWDVDVLRWELEPDGDGTRLVLTTWLGDGSPAAVTQAGAGYHVCLDTLESLLEGAALTPLAEAETGPLEKRYHDVVESA
jgi:uncharacterized protein YndB with AHSA1/START domain